MLDIILNWLKLNKTILFKILILIISVVVVLLLQWLSGKAAFQSFLIYTNIIVLGFFALFMMTFAAHNFFRSLFIVGAGASLVIFIAQSYCASGSMYRIADDSAKFLTGAGIIYLSFLFFKALYAEVFGDLKPESESRGSFWIFKEINKGKISFLTLSIYTLCLTLFVWHLVQVSYSVIGSLCFFN